MGALGTPTAPGLAPPAPLVVGRVSPHAGAVSLRTPQPWCHPALSHGCCDTPQSRTVAWVPCARCWLPGKGKRIGSRRGSKQMMQRCCPFAQKPQPVSERALLCLGGRGRPCYGRKRANSPEANRKWVLREVPRCTTLPLCTLTMGLQKR